MIFPLVRVIFSHIFPSFFLYFLYFHICSPYVPINFPYFHRISHIFSSTDHQLRFLGIAHPSPSFRSTWAIIRRRNNSSSTGIWAQKKPTWLGNPPINKGKNMFFIWENHRKTMGTQIKWRLYSWEIPSINGGFSIATGMITKEVYGLSTSRFRYAKMRSLVNLD